MVIGRSRKSLLRNSLMISSAFLFQPQITICPLDLTCPIPLTPLDHLLYNEDPTEVTPATITIGPPTAQIIAITLPAAVFGTISP
jgi:hypothetical protein